MAWTTAVSAATIIPTGVNDFRDHARYTRAKVAGTAIIGFIMGGTGRKSCETRSWIY